VSFLLLNTGIQTSLQIAIYTCLPFFKRQWHIKRACDSAFNFDVSSLQTSVYNVTAVLITDIKKVIYTLIMKLFEPANIVCVFKMIVLQYMLYLMILKLNVTEKSLTIFANNR